MTLPERKNYPPLDEVKAPYVHAVKHDATLYVSGLTAFGTAAQQGDMPDRQKPFLINSGRLPRLRIRRSQRC